MATDVSNHDEYLKTVYTNPFVHRGVVWAQHTSQRNLEKCEKLDFLPDDIVVATYPRSGTTLTQEIVWQIVNHEVVKKDEQYGNIMQRFPFLEFDAENWSKLYDELPPGTPNPIDVISKQKSGRLIKTHLPYFYIRDQIEKVNPKTIVVMRNPKDNVVSCYNFYKGLTKLKEDLSFTDFWRAYMCGKMINGDYCEFNSEYWRLRDRANVLMAQYEDIVHQPFQEIRKIALFLGYSLSAEKISTIVHNTTFSVMSKNDATNVPLLSGTNKFMRKGKVGDWKDWLTVAQDEAMDAWISEKFTPIGLNFTYE